MCLFQVLASTPAHIFIQKFVIRRINNLKIFFTKVLKYFNGPNTPGNIQEMSSVVKKSLGAPIRQMTNCLSGVQDGFSRKNKTVRRKSAPCCYGQTAHDSSWIRAYQAELHKERQVINPDNSTLLKFNQLVIFELNTTFICLNRKLRQVKFAQKNAERAAMRAHYKSPHHFSKVRL